MTNDAQVTIRFPLDVLKKLDAMAKRLSKEQPGVRFTRAAVIRMLVMKNVSVEESKKG